LEMDFSNLTDQQVAVIQKLAWFAESHCDDMIDIVTLKETKEAYDAYAEECSDLWDKAVKHQQDRARITI